MANFGKVDTGRKTLSQVIAARTDDSKTAVEWNTTQVNMVGANGALIEPMGIPVIWNGTNWERYVAQVVADADASDLPNGAKVAIVVGDENGVGYNQEDVALAVAGVPVTVLYSGDAAILFSGVDATGIAAPALALFKAALAAQGVRSVQEAAVVAPTYNR